MRAILFCILTLICTVATAGNFAVSARDVEFARQVGAVAETARRDLAIEWLGYELPLWSQRCPIYVVDGDNLGAAGETSFMFGGGTVGNWNMQVQGSRQRILDSVVPHEVMHTVLASHFKQQLPRWLDEGSCSSIEHGSQRNRLQTRLIDFLKTQRGIPFDAMFAMREYPRDILPLYAQGHSVCTFLQQHDSKPHFVSFVTAGLRDRSWSGAVEQYYGYRGLGELQQTWLDWVKAGSPLASNSQVVTVNRLFGGCRLRWDPGRRIFIRQCQPPRQAQPVVAQPRPVQQPPRQPTPTQTTPSQPPTDINDLPPVAQTSPPQTQQGDTNQSGNSGATCGPCNLTPIVVAIEGIQKELASLKLVKGPAGPQGEPGPQGPAGPPGQAGADGKDGKDADDAKLLEVEANVASLTLQVKQLQAGADNPLIVNIMDQSGTVLDHKEIYISKGQPLNLELQPIPVSAPIGAAAPASAP